MINSRSNRPGGPLVGKPIQGSDGRWYNQFKEEIKFDPKNVKFSDLFWSRNQPTAKREAMMDNIISASGNGLLALIVDHGGITDMDKERLSAYRVLAKQMGYEVGLYRFNPASGNVTALICKV